jgi:hypothetical protein
MGWQCNPFCRSAGERNFAYDDIYDLCDRQPCQAAGLGCREGKGEGEGEGAGGKHSESNVVVNGGMDYGDVFDGYYESAMDSVANGDGAGSSIGDIVSGYFEGLN